MVRGHTDFNKKGLAIILRRRGKSYRDIEKSLGVRKSTLSGWLKNVKLSDRQIEKLHKKWLGALVSARAKAVLWHNQQSEGSRKAIKKDVEDFFSDIKIDQKMGELILAMFYLAEGGKTENSFMIANSNPKILKGILTLYRNLYKLDESKFSCSLHLRNDQKEKDLKRFWSEILEIPEAKFTKTQFDKRTIKKTYDHYKGVCVVNYFDMALQRRIMYIGDKLLEVIEKNMGA